MGKLAKRVAAGSDASKRPKVYICKLCPENPGVNFRPKVYIYILFFALTSVRRAKHPAPGDAVHPDLGPADGGTGLGAVAKAVDAIDDADDAADHAHEGIDSLVSPQTGSVTATAPNQ